MEYTQEIKGKIHSVESFGSVDGPGVRYIVFLQGCHMRCKYCHNPETWAMEGGEELTAKEVFDKAYRYRNYWKKNGGITVSGGEALLQIDFVIALFKLAKEKGVHTTLDTSGNPFIRDFVGSLKPVERFEILPYHTLGVFKWENLGIPYELGDVMPPTKEEIAHAEEILHTADYKDYAK